MKTIRYSCRVHTTEGDIFLFQDSVEDIYEMLRGLERIYTILYATDLRRV